MSQKIKCVLCAGEWTNKQSTWTHPENDCPLAGSYTYRPIVMSVNKAIEAAKVDERKPEDCVDSAHCCKEVPTDGTAYLACCPCAAWRKE